MNSESARRGEGSGEISGVKIERDEGIDGKRRGESWWLQVGKR